MINKYVTKSVTIEAIRYTPDTLGNILQWTRPHSYIDENNTLFIRTLEGDMRAEWGDFIIKGLKGEFYPCKPDVFYMKYDEVNVGNGQTT